MQTLNMMKCATGHLSADTRNQIESNILLGPKYSGFDLMTYTGEIHSAGYMISTMPVEKKNLKKRIRQEKKHDERNLHDLVHVLRYAAANGMDFVLFRNDMEPDPNLPWYGNLDISEKPEMPQHAYPKARLVQKRDSLKDPVEPWSIDPESVSHDDLRLETIQSIKTETTRNIDISEILANIEITDAVRRTLDKMVTDEFLASIPEIMNDAFSSNDLGVVFTTLQKHFIHVDTELINDHNLLGRIRITDNIQEKLEDIMEYNPQVADGDDLQRLLNNIFQTYDLQNIFIRLQKNLIDIDLDEINRAGLFDGIKITDSTRKAVNQLIRAQKMSDAGYINSRDPECQVDSLVNGFGVPGTEIREALLTCEKNPDPSPEM